MQKGHVNLEPFRIRLTTRFKHTHRMQICDICRYLNHKQTENIVNTFLHYHLHVILGDLVKMQHGYTRSILLNESLNFNWLYTLLK